MFIYLLGRGLYMYEDRHSWTQYHAFSEKTGITVRNGFEGVENHFKDARGFLKHLRNQYPDSVFKSQRFHYYGVYWVIYLRD